MYSPSILEKHISTKMKDLGIVTPGDIDIEKICYEKGIFYEETNLPSHYVITNNQNYVFVNQNLSEEKKREHFFHELAHVVFHNGLQTSISKENHFVQERDARNFTKYALIPFHTLKFIDWDSDFVVEEVMEMYKVSEQISIERLLGIKENITMKVMGLA